MTDGVFCLTKSVSVIVTDRTLCPKEKGIERKGEKIGIWKMSATAEEMEAELLSAGLMELVGMHVHTNTSRRTDKDKDKQKLTLTHTCDSPLHDVARVYDARAGTHR